MKVGVKEVHCWAARWVQRREIQLYSTAHCTSANSKLTGYLTDLSTSNVHQKPSQTNLRTYSIPFSCALSVNCGRNLSQSCTRHSACHWGELIRSRCRALLINQPLTLRVTTHQRSYLLPFFPSASFIRLRIDRIIVLDTDSANTTSSSF